jgi:integrase
MREPWGLEKKVTKKGRVWAVRFWDYEKCKYTKTTRLGIPVIGKDGNRRKALIKANALYQKRSEEKKTSLDLISLLETYWTPDSFFIHKKNNTEEKPLSLNYITNSNLQLRKHVIPYPPFTGLQVHELKMKTIEEWKIWALERGSSRSAVNKSLEAMRVAVRDALQLHEINYDPFLHVKRLKISTKEKGILNDEELEKLEHLFDTSPRIDLACKLAALLGLRMGEVLGMQWGDIDFNELTIHVGHNFVELDKLKTPKCDSFRTLPLRNELLKPFHRLKECYPYQISDNGYVMYNEKNPEVPMQRSSLNRGLKRVLKKIGIDSEMKKQRNITFHSLRHTFITHAQKRGLTLLETSALAGHKTLSMTEHYTHAQAVADLMNIKKKLEKGA